MTVNSFIKLVELPTKVASVFPFLVGSLYAAYRYEQFDVSNFLIMFVAMICLDMATTALNNYMDYKKAVKTHGFGYEEHNAIVKYELSNKMVLLTIGILVFIASTLGMVLFLITDILVLLLGMISFFFAAIYTWGPFPISRTPLGELISGLIMGGIITFISLYIHIFDLGIINFTWTGTMVGIHINFIEFISIFILTVPLITGIANIMLANNTCDMEDDFINRRFTLPLVIGKDNALRLFALLYMFGYLSIIIGVILKWLPLTCIFVLGTIIPIRKNIIIFNENQSKAETFITSVQNFILISVVYVVSLGAGLLLKIF